MIIFICSHNATIHKYRQHRQQYWCHTNQHGFGNYSQYCQHSKYRKHSNYCNHSNIIRSATSQLNALFSIYFNISQFQFIYLFIVICLRFSKARKHL